MNRPSLHAALATLLFLSTAQARHQVEIESTYEGNGAFRYRLKVIRDPYFSFFDVPTVIAAGETWQGVLPPPEDWVIDQWTSNTISWSMPVCTNVFGCQQRPYETVFRAIGSPPTMKTILIILNLSMIGGYHGSAASVNMVGYANVDCLVPGSESDPIPGVTNTLTRFKVGDFPDVTMDRLIRVGDEVRGVVFSYTELSTVVLQGSPDLTSWQDIAYIYGDAGQTSWETNRSLNGFGNYFRAVLAAEGHATNLPPISLTETLSAGSRTASSRTGSSDEARILAVRPTRGELQVSLETQPGFTYEVSLLDARFRSNLIRTLTATRGISTVSFSGSNLPNPGYFRARKLSQ